MIEELFFIKVLTMVACIFVGLLFTFTFIMMWRLKRDIEKCKKMYFWKGDEQE